MTPPRISIVIPNYNSGGTLERAVRSILDQQYPNLQLIICDAESTDDSRAIIDRYRDRFDRVVVRKDAGQADGLNYGFGLADGDAFGWLCADDELLPGALAHVGDLFAADAETDVLTGACERVLPDATRRIIPARGDAWAVVNVQNVIEQPATFWRAGLHRGVGPLDTGMNLCFDWDFWNRFRRAGAGLRATDRLLARYHFTAANKSGTAGRRFADEAYTVLRRHGPLRGRVADVYRLLYHHFDLRGCYDNPPTCTLARSLAFLATLATLRVLIGPRLLYLYNWHFAACQERGVKWW